MIRRCAIAVLSLAGLVACGGCATVNPRPDYERVAKYVLEATGQEISYRPGEDEIVERKVAELLAEGLTAAEAVQICLLNNPRLQAAFFDVGMARADLVQSGLLSNPSLGLSLRFPSGGGLANLEGGLAQNIVDLWQIPVRKRASERALDRAILELAREAGVLANTAKTAYYQAVGADRALAVTRENLEIIQRLLDLALVRQQAGVGTEVDVNLSLSELKEAELGRRSVELVAFEARSVLATLLGLTSSPGELDLRDPLPDPPEWALSAETLLTIAQAKRLDIQSARQALEVAAANAKLERLRAFPMVELGLEFERGERRRSPGGKLLARTLASSAEAGAFSLPRIGSNDDASTDFIIGPSIGLELPIFDQNQAQIAIADYAYYQTVKLLDALIREVTQETRMAYERATTALDTARFYRDELLPLRETSLELAHDAYRAGSESFLVVLEAQRTLLAARAGYVAALESWAVALVELERVTGQPIERILAPLEIRENQSVGVVELDRSGYEKTYEAGEGSARSVHLMS